MSRRPGGRPGLTVALLLLAAAARAENPGELKRNLQQLCDAEKLSGAVKLKDQNARAAKVATWLSGQSFGPDYKDFWSEFSAQDACDRPGFLADAARNSGIERCAFAESSARESKAQCAKKPTLLGDLQMLCGAEKPSGAAKLKDPAAKYDAVYEYVIAQRVTQAFNLFLINLHGSAPCDRAAKLRAKAEELNTGACPLAASWAHDFCDAKK